MEIWFDGIEILTHLQVIAMCVFQFCCVCFLDYLFCCFLSAATILIFKHAVTIIVISRVLRVGSV